MRWHYHFGFYKCVEYLVSIVMILLLNYELTEMNTNSPLSEKMLTIAISLRNIIISNKNNPNSSSDVYFCISLHSFVFGTQRLIDLYNLPNFSKRQRKMAKV